MAKGFNKVEGEAFDAAVCGIVERAISSLQAIGMSNEGALSLLMFQAAIRMQDAAEVRRLLKSIEDRLADDDGP